MDCSRLQMKNSGYFVEWGKVEHVILLGSLLLWHSKATKMLGIRHWIKLLQLGTRLLVGSELFVTLEPADQHHTVYTGRAKIEY